MIYLVLSELIILAKLGSVRLKVLKAIFAGEPVKLSEVALVFPVNVLIPPPAMPSLL